MLLGPFFVHYSPYDTPGPLNSPPTPSHPFGTDYLGHDLLSQVIFGAYPSLLVALVSALGATLLGFFAGALSGYFAKMDVVIGGATDTLLTFPVLPLMIIIGTLFLASDGLIIGLLVLLLWPTCARAVRAQVASVKRLSYVEAAKTTGLNDRQIVRKIIIPEVAPLAVAYFIINSSLGIVIVTVLQFFGLGNPNIVSWGSILYWAQNFGLALGDWWWVLSPGLLITLMTVSFALIGFSVEEISNPKLRT